MASILLDSDKYCHATAKNLIAPLTYTDVVIARNFLRESILLRFPTHSPINTDSWRTSQIFVMFI